MEDPAPSLTEDTALPPGYCLAAHGRRGAPENVLILGSERS